MLRNLSQQPQEQLTTKDYIKLSCSGVVAFISDTIGVGSFAVNIALGKTLGTFKDDEFPGLTNGAQVIPGTLSAIFFMNVFQVDHATLLTLILGACLGGLLGGYTISRLNKQAIRASMLVCFLLFIGLLSADLLNFVPTGGDLTALHGAQLVIGFFGMILCGSLTSAGIGLFAMVQAVLFLLGMSPIVAFPIMTAAGAMQQPLTALVFLKKGIIPIKRTLLISLSGCVGVFLALPLVSSLSTH